jgi:hypothetical protein
MPLDTRGTWKAGTSSSVSLSGERPKYRLNLETALMQDRCVAGDMFRIVMSSIMRRRRGLNPGHRWLLSEENAMAGFPDRKD